MGRDEGSERHADPPSPGARWETVSRVAAGLSHEVRNPLNALAIHLEVLADKLRRDSGGTVPAHLEKNLQAARAQVARIDAVVRRFGDFAGARDFGPGETELGATLEEVAALARHEAGRRGVELTAAAAEGLVVAAGGPALVHLLVALLLGLLDGGVGGGRLVLSARADAAGAAVVVEQEAGGLDAAVARAAVAGAGEGRGAIAGTLAACGGTVDVEARENGTAVVLRLPLARRERSGAVA